LAEVKASPSGPAFGDFARKEMDMESMSASARGKSAGALADTSVGYRVVVAVAGKTLVVVE
jgi:hypothetical protein